MIGNLKRLNRILRGSGNAFVHAALARKEKAQNRFVPGLTVFFIWCYSRFCVLAYFLSLLFSLLLCGLERAGIPFRQIKRMLRRSRDFGTQLANPTTTWSSWLIKHLTPFGGKSPFFVIFINPKHSELAQNENSFKGHDYSIGACRWIVPGRSKQGPVRGRKHAGQVLEAREVAIRTLRGLECLTG